MTKVFVSALALAAATTVFAGVAEARDQIQIVGSSTVFPFSTAVAERFGQSSSFKAPVVESTGTGGGMKLFCAGIGEDTPDMTNASRRIKESEFKTCKENGVTPVEVKVGFDGIVLANSKAGAKVSLTIEQMFLALAKDIPQDGKLVPNPYKTWAEIDPALPSAKIEVLGPPPTSGTRDAFTELVMEEGCKKVSGAKELGLEKKACHAIREDGAYIEAGENDNLIVQKLEANTNAFGIFGFSFLDQNADKLQGAEVDGVAPEFEKIASGDYEVSRSLYFYVKKEHVGVIPGIAEYVTEFTSEGAWGDDGYLAEKGLIPLPKADRDAIAASAAEMKPLEM